MPLPVEDAEEINHRLRLWRQGDVALDSGLEFLHLCDVSRPLSPASRQIASTSESAAGIPRGATPILDEVAGLVMLTQTCDIRRDCRERPFVEVAPLIPVTEEMLTDIRRLRRPAFAYVPGTAVNLLVADLDRIMTVEKTLVSDWTRVSGWETDEELREFTQALSRKSARFAFPDDFNLAARRLQDRILSKHDRKSEEGAHLRALSEIRIRAAPSWDNDTVQLSWWFVKEADPDIEIVDWSGWATKWMQLFDRSGRFHLDPPTVCRLEDMTARDYVESDRLDLDRVSSSNENA
jgi:hypothetical protein